MESRDILVDQFGAVAVTGGIVRLEMMCLEKIQGASENPKFESMGRLAFSLDTLLKLNQAISATLAGLESRGVVKRNDSSESQKKGAPSGTKVN